MVFDKFDDGVDFGADGLFIASVSDSDSVVVFVVFGD